MLLFFDIDGTLFDDRRNLPASVRPALEQASRNGHSLRKALPIRRFPIFGGLQRIMASGGTYRTGTPNSGS